ncbi:SDR family oxidoreductase [Hydrogenophaga sp.]|uniref:SDR family oxidoreductase n=1 Tax=Hydrogenophaga sp. TaxID=1904254 RepID=UPI0025BF9E9E|nr:SDR family oxidoreductase [Hydrogenophaga sp.]MBT9462424.1 SDR family oxidoreductase [Hydrogenophaga sp.]
MNIVIIGGSGLIGKQLTILLRQTGHTVTAASPSSGVNAVTGEGLSEALEGAQVVVDVTNSPSFDDEAVMHFFRASTQNLLAACARAGVSHFVALSVVGSERLPESGYFRAKVAQEALIKAGPVPYTLVRATQFFEFLMSVAHVGTVGNTVPLPSAPLQPIAAADVAAALADVAVQVPLNGTCEVAGPQALPLDALIRRVLQARQDPREVVSEANALYFGTRIDERSLVPGPGARIGPTTLAKWLANGY